MKRRVLPFILMVFLSTAHAEDKAPKKEPLPQLLSSHVESLNKKVEAWQSESESAGRRTRENVDRRLNQWERRRMDFQEQYEGIWSRLKQGYRQGHRSIMHQIAEFQSVWHQVDSFLHSK